MSKIQPPKQNVPPSGSLFGQGKPETQAPSQTTIKKEESKKTGEPKQTEESKKSEQPKKESSTGLFGIDGTATSSWFSKQQKPTQAEVDAQKAFFKKPENKEDKPKQETT